MKVETLKKLKLPDKPGVYFFLGPPKHSEGGLKGREITYIGKSTSLKSRVKSYFGKDLIATRGPMFVDMVLQADKIDWRTTDNVLEALILEASLIKAHQPKYNSREKSDTSFNYVSITKELLPKVLIIRGKEIDFEKKVFRGQKLQAVFGPFTSGGQLNEAMKIIRRIFPYIDASSSKKQNYQFYAQLGLSPEIASQKHSFRKVLGPPRPLTRPDHSEKNVSATLSYLQNIKYIKLFFRGKKKYIIRDIKKEMMTAAKAQEFERADELKRQLFALQHINDIALLKNENYAKERAAPIAFRIEAYDIAHMSGRNMVGVMTVVENSAAVKSEYKRFSARGGSAFGGKTVLGNSKANDIAALVEILTRRLAHTEWTYPNLIVVDGGAAQINAASRVLKKMGSNIPVVSVVKDERHRPKNILGNQAFSRQYESPILLANSEAHRFAIAYHKNMRGKNFLK